MAHGSGGTALDERPPTSPRGEDNSDPVGEHGRAGEMGPRQARRLRAQRRRFWLVIMPIVAVALGLTVAIGAAIRSGTDDGSAAPAAPSGATQPQAPPTVLIGHRAANGAIDLMVLVGANGSSASVLLLPTATQVEAPSLGPQAVADLPSDEDQKLLTTTVENLLGVRVAHTLMLDDAGMNALLTRAAPIPVDLSREVTFKETAEGSVPAGPRRASAGEAARLLIGAQPGSELDRLVTVQDVLNGWFRRLRDPAVARATVAVQPALATMVAAARSNDRRTDTLPVESVTTGGGERFEPRAADVNRYADAAFADARLAVGGRRPRVEILNGTGAVGLAQTIAERIVPAGGQVTLTGNLARFGLAKTQVVYYRDADRAAAQRLTRALGCGSLTKANKALGVVDVTILAGADCFQAGTPAP